MKDLNKYFTNNFTKDFNEDKTMDFTYDFCKDLIQDFTKDFIKDFTFDLNKNFNTDFYLGCYLRYIFNKLVGTPSIPKAEVQRAAYRKAGVLGAAYWRKRLMLRIFRKKCIIFVLNFFPIFYVFWLKVRFINA